MFLKIFPRKTLKTNPCFHASDFRFERLQIHLLLLLLQADFRRVQIMWRRVSAQLQTLAPSWRSSLNLLRSNGRSSIRNPSFLASSSSSSSLFSTSVSGNQNPNPQSPSLSSFRLNCWWFLWWTDSSIGKKRVENIMLIATGHEREELEAEIEVCRMNI